MNDQTLIGALRELRAAQQHHEAVIERHRTLANEERALHAEHDAATVRLNEALTTVTALLKTTDDPQLAEARP